MAEGTLMGPMHNTNGLREYEEGLKKIVAQGGRILCGGKKIAGPGNYVEPTIVEISPTAEIVKEEIFAPIVYVFKFQTLDQAIAYNNGVPQGLSSALFTKNL